MRLSSPSGSPIFGSGSPAPPPVAPPSPPPPHAAATRATPQAMTRSLLSSLTASPFRLVSRSRAILLEEPVVLAPPQQAHTPTPHLQGLHRRHRQVLLDDDELSSRVELDDVARERADVDDVAHPSCRGALTLSGLLGRICEPDLLRAHGERSRVSGHGLGGAARQQVGDSDEARDETGRRALVNVGRRADLLDPSP